MHSIVLFYKETNPLVNTLRQLQKSTVLKGLLFTQIRLRLFIKNLFKTLINVNKQTKATKRK